MSLVIKVMTVNYCYKGFYYIHYKGLKLLMMQIKKNCQIASFALLQQIIVCENNNVIAW